VALSAGYNFGLALTDTGQVLAWGNNSYGQVGQNTANTTPVTSAVFVQGVGGGAALSGVAMVAAGGNHALALDSTGRVYSWGYSQNGELGDGANHPRVNASPLPAAVVGTAGNGQLGSTRAIAAGYAHSLALASDGSLLIWGSGFRGNLGQGGTVGTDAYVPLPVKDEAGTATLSLAPLTVWPNLLLRGR
jgi:alpha-tubulin suppressor-like RCC1 family protein